MWERCNFRKKTIFTFFFFFFFFYFCFCCLWVSVTTRQIKSEIIKTQCNTKRFKRLSNTKSNNNNNSKQSFSTPRNSNKKRRVSHETPLLEQHNAPVVFKEVCFNCYSGLYWRWWCRCAVGWFAIERQGFEASSRSFAATKTLLWGNVCVFACVYWSQLMRVCVCVLTATGRRVVDRGKLVAQRSSTARWTTRNLYVTYSHQPHCNPTKSRFATRLQRFILIKILCFAPKNKLLFNKKKKKKKQKKTNIFASPNVQSKWNASRLWSCQSIRLCECRRCTNNTFAREIYRKFTRDYQRHAKYHSKHSQSQSIFRIVNIFENKTHYLCFDFGLSKKKKPFVL